MLPYDFVYSGISLLNDEGEVDNFILAECEILGKSEYGQTYHVVTEKEANVYTLSIQ